MIINFQGDEGSSPVFVNAMGFAESQPVSNCIFHRMLIEGWRGVFIGPHAKKHSNIPGVVSSVVGQGLSRLPRTKVLQVRSHLSQFGNQVYWA